MKTLRTGLLVFLIWTSLSTYEYVCRIKGLCTTEDQITILNLSNLTSFHTDSLSNTLMPLKSEIPQTLHVYFDFDKSEFCSNKYITGFFEQSLMYMRQNRSAYLSITGFTDEIGSDVYNRGLGYLRAKSVRQYFQNNGIESINIMIGSNGENDPAENNNTSYGRTQNRRAEISIIP